MTITTCTFKIIVIGLLLLFMIDADEAQELANHQTARQDTFSVELLLESVNGKPQHIVLTFGAQEGATDGYDNLLDQFAPPVSPEATFEAYFPYDHPELPKLLRDIRSNLQLRHVWTVVMRGAEGTMTWYPHTMPRYGTFLLDDVIDMRSVTTANFALNDTMTIIYNKAQAIPDINVEVISYDFGDVLLGEGGAWTFPVFNIGDGDLLIDRVTFDQPEFNLVWPTFPARVTPSDSLNMTISFIPSKLGPVAGNLFIYSNDPDAFAIFIALLGTGVSPEIDITSTSHDFGQIPVGETGEWELVVLNQGTSDLFIDTVYTDNPKFNVNPGSLSISPGGSQAIVIQFSPSAPGSFFGVLTMNSNDLDEPSITVFLAGTGITPEIELSATHYDYGTVAIDDTEVWELIVSNTGALGLVVDTIASSHSAFSVHPHGFNVSSDSSRSVTVSFSPVSIGPYEGQLRVVSNDPDEPLLTVFLTGEGIQEDRPDIFLEDTGHDFGQVEVGQFSLWNFNVINLGTQHLTIENIQFEHPAFTADPNSFTVSPSNLQDVWVTFAPTTVETISAQLTIHSNDPNEPVVNLLLTGIGIPATSVEEIIGNQSPEDFQLGQNVPNPFNAITDIRYQIADRGYPVQTTLKIFNILGREMRTLVDEVQGAGHYTVSWDGRDEAGHVVSSGFYCYRLQAGRFVENKLMLLLR